MIEQLLQIQSTALAEGAWKTAQLVNLLMSQTMAAATDSPPEPAKPKRKEKDNFEYIPRPGSIMLDFKEVRRLVNAKQAAEGLPIHQIARQMGFDNGTSALPGFRTADKAKDQGYSIHAAKLSRILGDSILIKETPPAMAEEKPLTPQVNKNVCLKPTKEKRNMHQTVEVLHPWKQRHYHYLNLAFRLAQVSLGSSVMYLYFSRWLARISANSALVSAANALISRFAICAWYPISSSARIISPLYIHN